MINRKTVSTFLAACAVASLAVAMSTPGGVLVASFVNPKRVPQMADADAVIAGLPQRDGVSYIGLVLNEKGLEPTFKRF